MDASPDAGTLEGKEIGVDVNLQVKPVTAFPSLPLEPVLCPDLQDLAVGPTIVSFENRSP